ncbi:hypothetical protein GIB67_002824 [Kingdonia uniflora]|uniref:Lipase n=1 Tax=Kingdonia uniflora TaxID=39325 RepID=A0A7J7M5D0_9MAGN|nr:hypothetical protein GIB67_002824 [Kingdonia uniflora]
MASSLITFLRWFLTVPALLVLVVQPYPAYASSRGALTQVLPHGSAPTEGLCKTSVHRHGYKCQEFKVRTSDRYILGMQRIQAPNTKFKCNGTRIPVILQHGVLMDGQGWFVNTPSQSLPLVLADNGFDVWIANSRGTRYSSQHDIFNPTDPEFWDWSWDELASEDLPAFVNFVSTQTKQKPHYIGHSQGTIMALAAFSEGKVYDKLRSAVLLSPVAYLHHITTVFGQVLAKSFLADIGSLIGLAEFDLQGFQLKQYFQTICSNNHFNCYDAVTLVTGNNCCLNSTTMPEWLNNQPAPSSMKNMVHLSQTVRGGVFAKYDYGSPNANKAKYGQEIAPCYNLANITKSFPLFISHGALDALSDPVDVDLLMDQLKSHDGDKLTFQFVKNYAHLDFILGMTANEVVWKPVMAFLKRY